MSRIHWRLSTILRTSKNVWSSVFWYVKVCIFWRCTQYTIHWNKTQMFKKNPPDKISGTKNVLFFLPRAPISYSCTFKLRFLHELKHKICLSKTMYRFFHFDSVSFLLRFIFSFNKIHGLLDLKRHNSFQNQNNRKATHRFAPRLLIFKLQ